MQLFLVPTYNPFGDAEVYRKLHYFRLDTVPDQGQVLPIPCVDRTGFLVCLLLVDFLIVCEVVYYG